MKTIRLTIALLGLGLLMPMNGWAAEQKANQTTVGNEAWNPNTLCGLASPGLKTSAHQYYDIPAWNCDGSLLLIIGVENNPKARKQPYLVTELGTEHRRAVLPQQEAGTRASTFQWDVADPNVLYYAMLDRAKNLTTVHRLNVHTSANAAIVAVSGDLGLGVPHPDGNHLLVIPRVSGSDGLYLVSLRERKATPIPLPAAVHRVRFTKHPDLSVFCNTETENPATDRVSYRLDITNNEHRALVKGSAGHPDWSPDGTRLSFFMDGGLHVLDSHGKQLQHIPRLAGHQSWSFDGKYIVFDAGAYIIADETGKKRKFPKYISMIELASQQITPLVAHQTKPTNDQGTHPHPIFSPDGTKVVFNSNNEGKTPPLAYVVRARKPAAVQNLTATQSDTSSRLSWTPPQARETKRFLLYRLMKDGSWVRFAEADRTQTSATAPIVADVKGYGVVVEEFSGLQSEMYQTLLK